MYNSFKEMPVWILALQIAVDAFNISENFPKKEDYNLTYQLRRAASSISANIAEGYGRNHSLDKINFYYYSRASVTETQSHIEYAKTLDTSLNKIYNDLNKIINSLR